MEEREKYKGSTKPAPSLSLLSSRFSASLLLPLSSRFIATLLLLLSSD